MQATVIKKSDTQSDFAQSRERIACIMQDFIKDSHNALLLAQFQKLSLGKMLRSKLLLAISGESDEALKLCAIIELIQSASLLHDDVIDNATTRRSKPSINALFGNKNAIMLGDCLYSKAFFELASFNPKIAKSIADSVFRLSIGEIEDVAMSECFNDDKERYIQMCADKTASLIAASAECGAILRGFVSEKYKNYGLNLGIAFQIVDDILDITQSQEVLGKPAMSDFSEGKATLPYILFSQRADKKERDMLLSLYKCKLDTKQQQWIQSSFAQYNCISDCIALVQDYATKALDCIQAVQDPNATEVNARLRGIVKNMTQREF